MTGSKGIARLLDRHKIALSREIDSSSILQHLVKKGVLSHDDERKLVSERNTHTRSDLLVEMFAQKGFNAFRELCMILELECPHLLTSLLLDSTGKIFLINCERKEEEESLETADKILPPKDLGN